VASKQYIERLKLTIEQLHNCAAHHFNAGTHHRSYSKAKRFGTAPWKRSNLLATLRRGLVAGGLRASRKSSLHPANSAHPNCAGRGQAGLGLPNQEGENEMNNPQQKHQQLDVLKRVQETERLIQVSRKLINESRRTIKRAEESQKALRKILIGPEKPN
jgi:hypothetical protein